MFTHPSWEIEEILREIGFKTVLFPIMYSVANGIVSNGCPFEDGHMWPMAIMAKK